MFETTYYIDGQGVVLSPLPDFERQKYPVVVDCDLQPKIGQMVDNKIVIHAATIVNLLKGDPEISVSDIRCEKEMIYTLGLPETRVILDTTGEPARIVASLQFLFNQFRIEGNIPDTIDLRFEKVILIPDLEKIKEASVSTAPAQ